jgi:hypothetical protein
MKSRSSVGYPVCRGIMEHTNSPVSLDALQSPMQETLAGRLHALHAEHVVRSAEIIRDWPDTLERLDQAIIYIREAMYLCTVNRISYVEESRIFSILSFAMPTHATVENEPNVLNQPDAYEAAYNEQLERRSCPECGDGICPVDE